MSAVPIPVGEDPFTSGGNVEILLNSEGIWFAALDVVRLLERAGHDLALRQLRETLEMLGEEL